MSKLKSIIVRIPEELEAALLAHKNDTGVSTSETVRRALKCWLGVPKPEQEQKAEPQRYQASPQLGED